MKPLTGKRVMITGGAIRLGAVLCRAFAAAGANLIIHYLHSGEDAVKLAQSLPAASSGEPHLTVSAQLADTPQTCAVFRSLPPVDILVNNAAIWVRSANGMTPGLEAKQYAINLNTPVQLIRELASAAGNREVCAVNILDAAVLRPDFQAKTPYEDSKRRLMEATRSLAAELAPFCRVNAVAPGPVIPPPELGSNGLKRTPAALPLKRAVSPEDVASAVVWLASVPSVTGAILPVDCGQSLNFDSNIIFS